MGKNYVWIAVKNMIDFMYNSKFVRKSVEYTVKFVRKSVEYTEKFVRKNVKFNKFVSEL